MLSFFLICALLVLLALWFVLPELLQQTANGNREERRTANLLVYQDQFHEMEADLRNGLVSEEQYQQDKEELQRRLLEDVGARHDARSSAPAPAATKRIAYSVATAIPIAALALYFVVGSPRAVTGEAPTPATNPASSQPDVMTQTQIQTNVAKLAKRLEENPNDAQGWIMLARSYNEMQNYKEAAAAYDRATALTSNDANLWADYAYALAMARGRVMEGKPTELANKALQIDPKNERGLILAGSAAFEARNYDQAIEYWQKVLKAGPSDTEITQTVTDRINEARRLAKESRTK